MAIEVMAKVWKYADASGGELLVLLALADFSNEKSGCAWPSIGVLCQKSRLSERQTQYVLKRLERKGLIRIGYNQGPHGTNLYYVMDEGGAAGCTGDKTAGVQSTTERGEAHCTQTVMEPLNISTHRGFQKPTEAQMVSHGNTMTPPLPPDECRRCWAYYESNGWKVGRNPMKNWQAAMVNWRKGVSRSGPSGSSARTTFELKQKMEAKQRLCDELKRKFTHLAGTGLVWENESARKEFIVHRKDIQEINRQIADS